MSEQPEVHPEYSLVFRELTARGIRFCVLRDELHGGRLAGDLDLLVAEDRFEETLSLLDSVGYRVTTSDRFVPFKTALRKHSGDSFVAIDLHRRVVQDGIVYMNHHDVLERRRAVHDYFLPADTDLLVILVFHNVLGKRRIQDKHYAQICRLIERADREALTAVLAANGTGRVVQPIIDEIRRHHSDPLLVEQARPRLVRALSGFDRGLRRRRFVRGVRRWWRRYDPRPRGRLYAFVGTDGSGKSSICRALSEALSRQGAFSVKSVYMGPWGSYQLKLVRGAPYVAGWSLTGGEWLKAMFRSQSERPSLSDVLRVTAKAFTGRPRTDDERALHRLVRERSRFYLTLRYLRSQVNTVKFFVTLTVEMYYRYWKVYRYLRRRKIVIADRYIYDLMTGGMHQVIPHYRRIRRLLCRLFFRPHRTFLLSNAAETILARKKDLSRDNLRKFQAIYETLAEEYGFERLTTNQPPDVLAQRFVERYFDEMVAAVRS